MSSDNQLNLFGLDLEHALQRVRLGWHQLLEGDESGLRAWLADPVVLHEVSEISAMNASIAPDVLSVALPESDCLVSVIDLPATAEVFLNEAVASHVDEKSPFPATDVAWGHAIMARSELSLKVAVAMVARSTAIAATNGLLIRDRTAFEEARNINAIIFDKTGTLTKGEFGITDTLVFDTTFTESDIVAYAASIEAHSEHPIAQGIVRDAPEAWGVDKFKAIPGKGAEGLVKDRDVKVVSPGYLRDQGLEMDDPRFETLSAQGKTVVFVLIDDKLAGAIALADIIREESAKAILMLQAMGIQCIMLTGDNQQVAEWVGQEIGLDEVIAEVLPEEKAAKVREVQSRGLIVAMTGDGVNDAPALAQANVGIAIGAGTDVAIETADIILVRSSPSDVVAIIELARATYNKMMQNLAWATGYNTFAIPAAAGGFFPWGVILTPALGAVFMSASTVICAINAQLLKLSRSRVSA